MLRTQLQIDSGYYYCEAQNWSKDKPDAFAGVHSQIGLLLSFDEASGIDDTIYNVAEGFFTDLSPLRIWVLIIDMPAHLPNSAIVLVLSCVSVFAVTIAVAPSQQDKTQ
jgi:hypothetical protein